MRQAKKLGFWILGVAVVGLLAYAHIADWLEYFRH